MIDCNVSVLEISIPGLAKYNPRGDVKKPSWFRLENDFLDDPAFDQAPYTAIVLWLYMIGQVNRAQRESVQLLTRLAKASTRLDQEEFSICVNFLVGIGKLDVINPKLVKEDTADVPSPLPVRTVDVTDTVRARNADVRDSPATGRDERDETGRDETPAARPPATALVLVEHPDPGDRQIAEAWLAHGLAACPWKSSDPSYSVEKFAVHVGKLRRTMGFTVDQTMAVLEFVKTDSFWQGKVTSPGGLLKRKDNGERKIDNILRAIKGRGKTTADAVEQWAAEEDAKDAAGRRTGGLPF